MQKPYSEFIKQYIMRKINEGLSSEYQDVKNNNIKVACILDEFSYECFKYEGRFTQLSINNWKQTIENINPDFLFVESAWQGLNKEWVGKISNLNLSKDKNFLSLIKYCNDHNIPTVFWSKEDPYDFNIFIESAKHFDFIFTTDSNSIIKYKQILNHHNIFVLPFAAQPRIHNPIDKDKIKIGKVAFAGGWYSKFPDRCNDMENLLKPAFKYGLHIYDRFMDSTNKKNLFPKEYHPYIKNSLDYKDMISQYKKYEVFLNVNSTDISPTTFSRRVFELLASGVPIISSYSKGIDELFKDIVLLSKDKNHTEVLLNLLLNDKELRDRISVLGQREIFSHHTYNHRFRTILDKIGIEKTVSPEEGVSVVTCTFRPSALKNILDNYNSQVYPLKELIIVINNDSMDLNYWRDMVKENKDIQIYKLPKHESLGRCLNFAIEKSQYPYISKFDDDDYYAPNYLIDSINAFKYTNASIVGKNTLYAYMEGPKLLVLRYPNKENRYSEYVAGSTLTIKKDVFNHVSFQHISRGEDTKFLSDCLNEGMKIYATDRFNHVVIRRQNIDTHSWKINEQDFLMNCEIIKQTNSFKEFISI